MACLEHETEVADREQMHQAVLSMGFYPTVRIVKTRRTGRLDDVTICVDEVEHVGVFVEFERTAPSQEDGSAVQAELDALARSLGVALARTSETYDSLSVRRRPRRRRGRSSRHPVQPGRGRVTASRPAS